MLNPEDHFARVDRLLWDGKQDPAKRMVTRVDAGLPGAGGGAHRPAQRDEGRRQAGRPVPQKLAHDPGLIYERARYRRRKEIYPAWSPTCSSRRCRNVARPDLLWRELDDAARHALARGQVQDRLQAGQTAWRQGRHHLRRGRMAGRLDRAALPARAEDGLRAFHAPA